MKPDYKNWIPKGMLVSLIAGTVLSLTLLLIFGVFGVCVSGKLRVVLGVVFFAQAAQNEMIITATSSSARIFFIS